MLVPSVPQTLIEVNVGRQVKRSQLALFNTVRCPHLSPAIVEVHLGVYGTGSLLSDKPNFCHALRPLTRLVH